MFIFTTNQDLWARELMGCIVIYDNSLDRKNIFKFILLFYDPIWVQ
jgi:hypothetical protein